MPSGLGFGPKRASEFAGSVFYNFWCVASVTRSRGSRGRVIRSFPCHAVASVMRPRHIVLLKARGRVSHAAALLLLRAWHASASPMRSRGCQFLHKLSFMLSFHFFLRACAHMGYLDRGLHYFRKMQNHYGLDRQMEHYSCMVDLLGRFRQVNEALKLIQSMPFEADDVIWRTLLSNCKMQRNIEVAEVASSSLLKLDPQDSSAYVLLSNVYANAAMWGEVAKVRNIMKNYKLKKEPGCSWIEVRNEVHAFLVGDKAHPRFEEIYEQICLLVNEMKWDGYVLEINFMLDEEAEEQEGLTEHQFVI
ncbi:Pentatricopeptide repeat-containing protein [Arachis hypogaea]|nr:Pentatricopeptide repeat-containing protein [Arachis hypogaea]